MKKLISVFLLFVLIISISACGTHPNNTNNNSSTTTINNSSANPSTPTTSSPKPTATPTPKDGLKSDGKIHVYLVGKGEKVNTPESSFINYITYYPNSKHLIICMNGKDYVFANISSSLWSDFKSADSKGTFYNKKIRDNSNYYINDYNGSNGNLIVLDYVN